ncbi:MAG TPA: YeeE/YedE thiosulfate transporter family protein [Usitatibacter sp.]|nr:YeeE/YedE thiosulfate transporter family protein [Usitatibacter sp.]
MAALFPLGWEHYLAGGLLLGVGMSLLFIGTGLIGGMSTVFSTAWSFFSGAPYFRQERFVSTRHWRLVYAAGIILGALLWLILLGQPFVTEVPYWRLAVGGFIAGFGARLSNGCTAGHGICGMASLQPASILAVCAFLATAMVTAHLVRTLL